MKNLIASMFFSILAAILLSVMMADAATIERVVVDYEYDTQGIPSYQPTSASLFVDGAFLCNGIIDQTDIGPLECNDKEIEPGEHSFTVALQMANGRQTPHSAPFTVIVPEPLPEPKAPTVIEFYLRVTVDGQTYEFTQ